MRRSLSHVLPTLGLFSLTLLLSACGGDQAGGAGMQGQMPAPEVAVVTLKSTPLTMQRELPGRVRAHLMAEVRPQVGGLVAERLFEEGAQVNAGDALYQLDDAVYRASLTSAQADLKRAEAVLDNVRRSAERSARIAKQGLISKEANDQAQSDLRTAEASVGVARAAVESARIRVDHARIEAPISGRIGKSSVTRGALVTANQDQALATIQQLDPVYIDLSQSSSEWLQLRREIAEGQMQKAGADVAVDIRLEDGSTYAHPGQLAFTDVSVDPNTGSTLLRVIAPNPDGLLLPGMYVRAVVTTAQRANGLLVPQRGVTRDPKGNASCMVVAADGKVQPRSIVVSSTQGDQWVVESGLAAGDRVVVAGLQKIQPGMAVRVVEFGQAAAAAKPTAGQ